MAPIWGSDLLFVEENLKLTHKNENVQQAR